MKPTLLTQPAGSKTTYAAGNNILVTKTEEFSQISHTIHIMKLKLAFREIWQTVLPKIFEFFVSVAEHVLLDRFMAGPIFCEIGYKVVIALI